MICPKNLPDEMSPPPAMGQDRMFDRMRDRVWDMVWKRVWDVGWNRVWDRA